MKGKRAAPGPAESVRHRLKADVGLACSVRPGAALETGTVSLRYRGQSARAVRGNAGGTAEGLPFVPISWEEGLFYCPNQKEELDNEVVGRARPRLD